jgi:MFS family permease
VDSLFRAAPWQIGLLIAGSSFAAGISATQLPRLYRRFSSRALLLASFALYAVAFCLMPHAPQLWWLFFPVFLYGLAQGMNIPLVSIMLTGQAPENRRAALMAANALILRLGQIVGPALFGSLTGAFGPAMSMSAGSVIAVGMAALVWREGLPHTLPPTPAPQRKSPHP